MSANSKNTARGKHANHLKGSAHPRWNHAAIISEHGYRKVRVGRTHPLADPNGYAYEHLLVWVSAGNPIPADGQILHHDNEDKQDNRYSNLLIKTRQAHEIAHGRLKLTDADVTRLRTEYGNGANGGDLAARYRVTRSVVYRILSGVKRKNAGGPIFRGDKRGKKAAGCLLDGCEWKQMPGDAA